MAVCVTWLTAPSTSLLIWSVETEILRGTLRLSIEPYTRLKSMRSATEAKLTGLRMYKNYLIPSSIDKFLLPVNCKRALDMTRGMKVITEMSFPSNSTVPYITAIYTKAPIHNANVTHLTVGGADLC